METLITAGVEVQVETVFQPEHSDNIRSEFLFAYHITLFNHNNFTVQLISRKWKISDSNFDDSLFLKIEYSLVESAFDMNEIHLV